MRYCGVICHLGSWLCSDELRAERPRASVKVIKADVTNLPVAMSSAIFVVFLTEMPPSSCSSFTASCPNSWHHRVLKGHVSHRGISANPTCCRSSFPHSAMTSQADFLNTGFIHRGLFPTRGCAPNKPSPWQLQPPAMRVPFLMLLCGKNERMRVRALHGHVLPCKQHVVFMRETFMFLAFICVFLTLSRSGKNDVFLFAGRNYFHISSFIYNLISPIKITIRIKY